MNAIKNKLNITSFKLKIIAIICMTIDHIGIFFMIPPLYFIFRIIGRMAFPIFCFLIVEGFLHTKNIKYYILRILGLAIISEPIIDKVFFGDFFYINSQNVLFLFAIALIFLNILDYTSKIFYNNSLKLYLIRIMIMIFASVVIYILRIEYGVLGLAMIFVLYYFKDIRPVLIAGLMACNFLYLDPIQAFGCLSIIPIILYTGNKGLECKYLAYFYYPLHVLILYIILVFSIGEINYSYKLVNNKSTSLESNKVKESSLIIDDETIRLIGIEAQKKVNNEYQYEDIELNINGIAILLNDNSTFSKSNSSTLECTFNIQSKTESPKIELGRIKNNIYEKIDLLDNESIKYQVKQEDGYIVIVNKSNQKIIIKNCKVKSID